MTRKVLYDGSQDLDCKNLAKIICEDDKVFIRYFNRYINDHCISPIEKKYKVINYKNYIVFYEPHHSVFSNSAVFIKRDNRLSVIATIMYHHRIIEYDGNLHVWYGITKKTHYQIYGIGRDDYVIDLDGQLYKKDRLVALVSCLHFKYDPKLVNYGTVIIDFEPKKKWPLPKIANGFWDLLIECDR